MPGIKEEENFYTNEFLLAKSGPENALIAVSQKRLWNCSPAEDPTDASHRHHPNAILHALKWDIIYLDCAFKITHIENTFLYGTEFAETIIGRPFWSLFPNVSDADQAVSVLERVIAEDAAWILQGPILWNNTVIYARMRTARIGHNSNVRIFVFLEDWTLENRRRLVAERLNDLMRVVTCGIAEFMLEKPVILPNSREEVLRLLFKSRLAGANACFLHIHGFSSIKDVECMEFRDFFSIENLSSDISNDQHHIAFHCRKRETFSGSGETFVNHEVICDCLNGHVRGFFIVCNSPDGERIDEDLSRSVDMLTAETKRISDYAIFLEEKVRETTKRVEESKNEADQYSLKLEKTNDALKILISGIEEQRKAAERKVVDKFKLAVQPILNQLRAESLPLKVSGLLNSLELQLEKIGSEYGGNIFKISHLLTFKELRICELINSGLSSKEIGEILGISPQTIFFHRSNIRKKLGLTGSPNDLASYLKAIS